MDKEKRILELLLLVAEAVDTREPDEFSLIKHPPSMWKGFVLGTQFALRGILPAGVAGLTDESLLVALISIAQQAGDPQMVDHLKAFMIRKSSGMLPEEKEPAPTLFYMGGEIPQA